MNNQKLYILTYYEKECDAKKKKTTNYEEYKWVFRHETYTNPGSFIEKVRHLTSSDQSERYRDINPGVVKHIPIDIDKVLNPFE